MSLCDGRHERRQDQQQQQGKIRSAGMVSYVEKALNDLARTIVHTITSSLHFDF